MKHKIPFADFLINTGTAEHYKEDTYELIYHDGVYYGTDDDARDNLPEKFAHLADLPHLLEEIKSAYARADEAGLEAKAYNMQKESFEEYADHLADMINEITPGAINSIAIDWRDETATIDANTPQALSAIRQIINGEGVFYFESDKELAESYDGKHDSRRAVKQHIHYLINGKLIADIYGMNHRTPGVKEINYWTPDEEYLAELLAEIDAEEKARHDNKKHLQQEIQIGTNKIKKTIKEYSTDKKYNTSIMRNVKSIETIAKA